MDEQAEVMNGCGDQKTFTLTKPSNLSGSAYFTIETVKNSSGNYASKPGKNSAT